MAGRRGGGVTGFHAGMNRFSVNVRDVGKGRVLREDGVVVVHDVFGFGGEVRVELRGRRNRFEVGLRRFDVRNLECSKCGVKGYREGNVLGGRRQFEWRFFVHGRDEVGLASQWLQVYCLQCGWNWPMLCCDDSRPKLPDA